MSAPKEVAVGGTVYFWFAANTTAGSAGDGATPLYDVRLAGAASGAAPTASGTPTLLTHANYSDGLHEIAIDTTGYAEGEYAVFCTLTISSVNPAGFVGSFVVRAAASTLYEVVQAILVDTAVIGALGAGLTAIPWNASWDAEVQSEVVDALNVDTYAEVGQEAPAATQTLRKMLAYLYKAWRNTSTQTATQYSLFGDDALTVDQKATVSDNATTFTKGEVGAGP